MTKKTEIFLTKAELAVRWGICTKTIENWVRSGDCPKPANIGGRLVRWKLSVIEAHEKNRS